MSLMEYKASVYNYSVALDEKTYIWMNGVSGGAFKADCRVHPRVETILANPKGCDMARDGALSDQLISLGFLIDEGFDEIEFLRHRHRSARYGSEGLSLGIIVTFDCNFACHYCYQQHLDKWMSSELRRGIVNYVENMMKSKRTLMVDWFGGEALLAISTIKELSEQFLQICNKYGARYVASLTTNGYLLTEKIARELSQLGVSSLQITIDGPPDIHDKRRILRDGSRTFDVILKNLNRAITYIPEVAVRINLDKTNSDCLPQLLPYLIPMKDIIALGVSPVSPSLVAQGYKQLCFQRHEYLALHPPLEDLLKREGFRSLIGTTADRGSLASHKSLYCGAYQLDSHLIDPDGDLYKCVALAGVTSTKVGTLLGDGQIIYDWHNLLRWVGWEPFDDATCSQCPVLPLCFGGCHADRLYPGRQAGMTVLPCSDVRYDLSQRLRWNFETEDA